MGEAYAIIDYIIAKLPKGYIYDDEEELLRAIRGISTISRKPKPFESYIKNSDWYTDQSPKGQSMIDFAEQGISDSIKSTTDTNTLTLLGYRADNHGFTSLGDAARRKIDELTKPTPEEQSRIDDVLNVLRRSRAPTGRPKDVLRILEEDLEDQLERDIIKARDDFDVEALEDISFKADSFSTRSRSRNIKSTVNDALRDIEQELKDLESDV